MVNVTGIPCSFAENACIRMQMGWLTCLSAMLGSWYLKSTRHTCDMVASGRRLLVVVTISGVTKCAYGCHGYRQFDVHLDSFSCRERKCCAFGFIVGGSDHSGDYFGCSTHVD